MREEQNQRVSEVPYDGEPLSPNVRLVAAHEASDLLA